MAPERYDPSAQVALLKVLTDVLRLSHAADVMYDVEEAQALRDGLARIDLAKPSASMAALADCIVLGHALKILDPTFDVSLIDRTGGPSRWLTTKRNLLIIYKGVFAYIRRSCRELMALAKVYDIRTTARNPDDQGMSQLSSIIVVSIFLGENNRDYIARLQTLEPAILGPIMHMIMAKQEECKRLAASTDVDELIDQVLQTRDVDLAHEEEHASILMELETSRKQGSDLLSRLEHLQRNYDELVKEHNRQQDELAELRRSGSDSEFTSQRDKQRIREQEDVIASQEGEIQGFNETIRGLKVQIRDYEKRVQKMDDLNDQVTELRHTNTELSKKANAAERYKQKLEAQQTLVTENSNLIFEKASLQKDYDDVVTKMSTLEDSLRKYKSRENSRSDAISEASREVDELRIELLKKDQELATLKALRENDERVIYELQDQLKNGTGTPTPSSFNNSSTFDSSIASLEQELSGIDDDGDVTATSVMQMPTHPPPPATATLEISRLKAEIAILKSETASSDEFKRLRDERDSMQAQCEALRRERLDFLEQQAAREKLILEVLGKTKGQSTLNELDTKFAVAKAEAEGDKKQTEELQAKLGDVERQLVVANASLTAISQPELEAIEILKQAEFAVSGSLRAELDANRLERSRLQTDLIQCQADLVAAYQSKDQIRKELDDTKADQESGDSVQSLKDKIKNLTEQLEKTNPEPRRKKAAKEGSLQGPHREALKHLERETALVSTAWYDVTSRMQSSHVVMQRRSDMPKSWIARQRQSVNGELVAFFRGLLRPPAPSPPSRPLTPRLLDAGGLAPPATRPRPVVAASAAAAAASLSSTPSAATTTAATASLPQIPPPTFAVAALSRVFLPHHPYYHPHHHHPYHHPYHPHGSSGGGIGGGGNGSSNSGGAASSSRVRSYLGPVQDPRTSKPADRRRIV